MSYGYFTNNGAQYVITTPKTPDRWFNYLFNGQYYMEVSQTAQGNSMCLTPDIRTYTRGHRYFYISDNVSGDCWNPTYSPLNRELESYRCTHSLGWTVFQSAYKSVEAEIKVFVPTEGVQEIWCCKVRNNSESEKDLSFYPAFSFEMDSTMGTKCSYDSENQILTSFTFPYHVLYEDKEKLNHKNKLIYMFSSQQVNSFDCSERWFFGGDDRTDIPAAVTNRGCSCSISEADKPLGVFEHKLKLQPGQEAEFNVVLGCANTMQEAAAVKEKFLQPGAVEEELERVEAYWAGNSQTFTVNTPDENLNYFVNYWLKKQVVLMAKNNRLSVYCPVRNQLQDAMGYGMLDGQGAAELMLKVMKSQETNGFIQQWYMTDGSAPRALCLLKHKDAPIWLISCMCALVHETGDISLLDKKVEFKDSIQPATVYDHLLRAAYYLAGETGEHGLVLMGDGDWTDPINGAGRLGRGESTWSTMGLIYSIQELLPLAQKRGDTTNVQKLKEICARLEEAINTWCWDGDWYVTGYDDNGVPFGKASDAEAKIFLNSQTWAIMSNTVKGDRLDKLVKSIDSLDTACGPLLLAPAFSGWNAVWGRISIKLAGTTENGSIYCHASMFKAYADCLLGRGDKAYDTIRKTLPTNPENPPEKSWQVPLFVPNYYFGLTDSPNFGHSSQHNCTGTAAWLIWVVVEHLLGARATVEGLQLTPCIPGDWQEFSIERGFRDARYVISAVRSEGAGKGTPRITVDGEELAGNILPYEPGSMYTVKIYM